LPGGAVPRAPHLLDAAMLWGPSGGVRRVLEAKHRWLAPLGWMHSVLAPGQATPDAIDCGGWRLPLSGGYRVVLSPRRAQRTIEHLAPDLIEVADPYTLAYAALDAAHRLRVPAVAYCHAHLPSLAARLCGGSGALSVCAERAARAHLLRLYERFDQVLAPSRWVVDDLRASGLRTVGQQALGVDATQFSPQQRDLRWRRAWLRTLGIDPRDRLLLYVGRFAAEKNLGLLTEAVRLLGPGHVLVALGSGPRPPHGERVHVVPPETEARQLARALASCDVFVHAGDRETFGLAALEAMACGVPLVVSAHCGLGELAQGVGVTLATRDPRVWAEAIDAQLDRPRLDGIAAGLARAQAHHWPRVLAPWLLRYRRLGSTHRNAVTAAHGGTLPVAAP
jgi:alpha-1,6-mannosyltransferase